MTRKEILFRENITLWNEYPTLTGAATTDLDEYAQTYKYQKALKESRAPQAPRGRPVRLARQGRMLM